MGSEWVLFHGWGTRLAPPLFRTQMLLLRALVRSFGFDGELFSASDRLPIRQSVPSYIFSIAGISSGVLILTYGGALFFPVVVIMMLGVAGMALSVSVPAFVPGDSEAPMEEDEKAFPKTVSAAITALFSFMALYWILSPIGFSSGSITYTAFFSTFQLPFATAPQQAASAAFLMFTVPWGEENFFRALWGNFVVRYLPPGVAELSGGVIFMTFHAAVYSLFLGPAWGLIGLLTGAGTVFISVDEYSGDVFASEMGHSLYNGLSIGIQGNVLGLLIGPAPHFAIAAPFGMLGLLAVSLFRKKGKGGPTSRRTASLRVRETPPQGPPASRTLRSACRSSLVERDGQRALGPGGHGAPDGERDGHRAAGQRGDGGRAFYDGEHAAAGGGG